MTPTRHPPRIAVVGSTNIDLVAYTSRVPDAGETIIGERFAMGFGGKGANQAVMARLLGAEVAMVNCVGNDPYGRMTLDNFAAFGVDTSHVHTVDGASGVAPIWVEPDGTNRIIVIPGANDALTPEQAVAAIENLAPIDVIVGQFEIPQAVTAAAFAAARNAGATTILNPAPGAGIDPSLLAETDWLIPNQVELGQVTGATVASDADLVTAAGQLGCRLLVTLGEDGAALVADGAVYRYPAPAVAAVDTTGAGDAFVGSFAYGLASGWDESQAVTLGVMCAADSVTRHGTQTSFPRDDRITKLLTAASEAASTPG
ncbi:MAG TPA: ribokinase [Acidimicrobiia bacterium]|nr:ribokinase [Acidimicrobiia bacterium]